MLSCFRDKKNKMPKYRNFDVKIKNALLEWRSQWRMILKKMWY